MKVATQKTFSSSYQLKHQLAKAEKLKVILLSFVRVRLPQVWSARRWHPLFVRGKCVFGEWVLAVTQWHSQRGCCTKYLLAIVLVSSRLTDRPIGLCQWGFTSQFTVTASSHIQTTGEYTFVLMTGGCQMVTDCVTGASASSCFLNVFMLSFNVLI